jgi:CheY-like chemotaxis protein
LLVEDNAMNQEAAKELLENQGYLVELASKGGEALGRGSI